MFTACKKSSGNGGGGSVDLPDGMYIFGAAVGVDGQSAANVEDALMGVGYNEADNQTLREGMYEKYVVIEAGKDFYFANLDGTEFTYWNGDLVENDSLPTDAGSFQGYQAFISEGAAPKAMQVTKTGLYHVILDMDLDGQLSAVGGAQIVIVPVIWGVSGAMNSWGWTEGEATTIAAGTKTISWTWKDQEMPAGGEFKYKNNGNWKINLDIAEQVKANANLGKGMKQGGDNIAVEKAGLYDITLTWTLTGGEVADSYNDNIVCTQEFDLPTTMYMIGSDFGNWDWAADGVVDLVPVHSHAGMFWCIRYFNAANGFKFCAKKAWSGDFTGQGNDSGYTVADGNCFVPADGLYTVVVDLKGKAVTIYPAEVYGMGDCFGGWDEGQHPFAVDNGGTLMGARTVAAGNLRMYAKINGNDGNWWQSEFNIYNGVIVYRADGNDQEAVAVGAETLVTLDFNAGTGSLAN